MKYVVIDTNVIVSALLARDRKTSVPFRVLKAVFEGEITPVLTKAIVSEYVEVLHRPKFGFDKRKVKLLLSELKEMSIVVEPQCSNAELPDNKDICFYEAALFFVEQGCLLITGNLKHFPNCSFAITPTQFVERLGNELSK